MSALGPLVGAVGEPPHHVNQSTPGEVASDELCEVVADDHRVLVGRISVAVR